jgi:hypothetical protein
MHGASLATPSSFGGLQFGQFTTGDVGERTAKLR